MINESFDVCFGVEFEFILAFHEELLRKHLQDTQTCSESEIIKDIPEHVRKELNQAHPTYRHMDFMYMGWGLTTEAFYESWDDEAACQEKEQLKKFGYRGYAGEILTLAEPLWEDEVVFVCHNVGRYYGPYYCWHLIRDGSLFGISKDLLAKNLNQAGRDFGDINDWDSHGLELVTRILPFEPSSFEEIDRFLTALRSTQQEGQPLAMITKACAMHVHIGLPPPEDPPEGPEGEVEDRDLELQEKFNLPTLQHLAYIVVMYEISMRPLFPQWRREGSAYYPHDISTNLTNFFEEPTCDDWDPEKDNFDAINATSISEGEEDSLAQGVEQLRLSSAACPTMSFFDVRSKIFAPNMTLADLFHLMNGESSSGYLVSWFHHGADYATKRTIEFKQHEGSLDPEEVKMWVTFVVGMLRLAELNSRLYGVGEKDEDGGWKAYTGEGYKWTEWDEALGVLDLIEMMELGEEGKQWVKKRIQMWE